MTIELSLRALTALAWRDRLDPAVYTLARELTDRESTRQQKMEAIADELHRRFTAWRPVDAEAFTSPALLLATGQVSPGDADDWCLCVAALAMSVGIRCRLVAARFGHSWTCWVSYEVGDHWETIDPMLRRLAPEPGDEQWDGPPLRRPAGNPDEQVMGPIPGEGDV